MEISVCGLKCNECPFYLNDCTGCYIIKGQPFWTKEFTDSGLCPLYECSVDIHGFGSCGDCPDLPCDKFQKLKDPNITEKEHKDSIKKRIVTLQTKTSN